MLATATGPNCIVVARTLQRLRRFQASASSRHATHQMCNKYLLKLVGEPLCFSNVFLFNFVHYLFILQSISVRSIDDTHNNVLYLKNRCDRCVKALDKNCQIIVIGISTMRSFTREIPREISLVRKLSILQWWRISNDETNGNNYVNDNSHSHRISLNFFERLLNF